MKDDSTTDFFPARSLQGAAALIGPAPRRPKIVLLSPRGPLYRHRTGFWKKSLRYASLTLTTLAALVPEELQAEIVLVDEGTGDIDLNIEADLVGISAITGTAPRSYELSDHFRKSGIPVVLGGVHPTLMPEEAMRHADAIVVGYAEESWPQLLNDFSAGKMKARYEQDEGLTLKNLPFARRDLLPAGAYTAVHTIEATRGCIHQCDFCVVPSAWGRPLQRPVVEVIEEIRHMKARRLIFLDLNLISDIDYAKALFSALIPLSIKWGGLATTLIAWDEELLDLAARSGCSGLLIGFESLVKDSLSGSRKAFNLHKDYHYVVRELHKRRIAVMGCFVFGFDHDTTETFAQTVDFVMDSNIDLPRFAILTPFPGTTLFHRLKRENRILTEDWSLYDGQHIVYQPARMTANELLTRTRWAWKETYRYSSIAKRLLGARVQLPIAIPTNLAYRFYANHLSEYYTCDWMTSPNAFQERIRTR